MNKKILLAFSLSFFLFSACEKETVIELKETGAISGTLRLYNDKTDLISDASGVIVEIIGLPGKTTTTGSDGKFTIDSLPFDNYDLKFSKQGYGTFKIFGIEHLRQSNTIAGATSVTQITRAINLGAVSTTGVVSLLPSEQPTYNDGPGIEYEYVITPAPNTNNRGYVRAFLGKKHTTSSTEYMAYTSVKSVLNNNTRGGFTAEELYGFGFNTGDSVYVKLYGDSFNSNTFTEPISGRTIFPNLNTQSPNPIYFITP